MITPCSAANGCGTLTPVRPNPGTGPFQPTGSLPYGQMTGITSTQAFPPSPAENIPSFSGIIASTVPMPGTLSPTAVDPPETIPGQPDPPLNPDGSAAGGREIPTGPPSSAVPDPVLPEAPQFQVPNNPLLPPGYQETISYENLQYLNGFLRTQIGRYMRVEQLVGSNTVEERYGYLIGVGINYILLQELGTGNVSALDYYNIKYVHIYYANLGLPSNPRR